MNNLSVEEGNKIIAEFMGIGHTKLSAKGHYHASWSWLMPVVEKIEALDYNISVVIKENKCGIYQSKGTPYEYCISKYEADKKIGATVLAVLETIKWYNNQKIKV